MPAGVTVIAITFSFKKLFKSFLFKNSLRKTCHRKGFWLLKFSAENFQIEKSKTLMSKLKFRFSQVEMHKYFYQKCISYVDIDREIFAITGEAFIIIRDTQEKFFCFR